MLLKKITPRSLFGRFLLIIVVPTVLVQMIAIYTFYERHWDSMSRNMSGSLAGEITFIVKEIETLSLSHWSEHTSLYKKYMNLKVEYKKSTSLPEVDKNDIKPYRLFEKALKDQFSHPFALSTDKETRKIMLYIAINGGVLEISIPHKRLASSTTYIFVMWMTGSSAILLVVAIIFLRNQIRPITRLAVAANKFGKGQEVSYSPRGAREVRQAGVAFIRMKERIHRLLTRRAEMLAGVSHDLKTPLTRMTLQLEMLGKSEAIEHLKEDVHEMESMIEGYLNFARGREIEASTDVQLSAFLKDIIAGYKKQNRKITLHLDQDITAHIKYHFFKRCLANVIDNALRFGKRVDMTVESTKDQLVMYIDDDGPGIPEDKYEEAFQPFYRLEESRNQKTGGAGLGLSIASDIVHAHGGEIALDKSPLGGLRVIITLPR